jgi:hypothetical protein
MLEEDAENKNLLKMQKQKQDTAKERATMMKAKQKGSVVHNKILTQLRIAEKELEDGKLTQKDLEQQVARNSKENAVMKTELAAVREQNDM